jgi:hypothetical protein
VPGRPHYGTKPGILGEEPGIFGRQPAKTRHQPMESTMKTPILILISAFLMAGCANNHGTGAQRGTPANPVVTSFSGSEQDTLQVQVTDPQPVTRVELAAPDGRIYLAQQIDRERLTRQGGGYYGQPTVGFGVGGGSGGCCWNGSGVGVGLGFGFPLGDAREPDYGPAGVVSTALVRVPDMAAYRAQWQQWKVRIYLGEGGNERIVEVAAPPPGAG